MRKVTNTWPLDNSLKCAVHIHWDKKFTELIWQILIDTEIEMDSGIDYSISRLSLLSVFTGSAVAVASCQFVSLWNSFPMTVDPAT